MANILILYYAYESPLRVAISDHLYSFERYSGHKCFYVNLYTRKLPRYILKIPFILVIFHTTYLAQRPDDVSRFIMQAGPVRDIDAVKIAIPQDEFFATDILCDVINTFGITHVYSVKDPSEWKNIYRKVDLTKVKVHRVLTGYLEKRTIGRIEALSRKVKERPIDIGYRAWGGAFWLGRHGLLKQRIAQAFEKAAPSKGFTTDISTRAEDTFNGDSWYEFMQKCRYTIGVEGGASILDNDASIRKRTEAYLAVHPEAGFEEVEAHCFPGVDGTARLMNTSPRHLEACVTKTCQVLVEGDYNGILKPNVHYIPIKADFSNIDGVLQRMKDETARLAMVERAYNDIVLNEKLHYESFVDFVLSSSLPKSDLPCSRPADGVLLKTNMLQEKIGIKSIKYIFLKERLNVLFYELAYKLPDPMLAALKKIKHSLPGKK